MKINIYSVKCCSEVIVKLVFKDTSIKQKLCLKTPVCRSESNDFSIKMACFMQNHALNYHFYPSFACLLQISVFVHDPHLSDKGCVHSL